MSFTVLVCKNTTCSQQGSAKVLAAFQKQASADTLVKRSGCLGECGSGPMVLIAPTDKSAAEKGAAEKSPVGKSPVGKSDKTWYSHVQPSDVPLLVLQHLSGGKVVRHKLYPKYHPTTTNWKGWFAVAGVLIALMVFMFATFAGQSYYF